MNWWFVAAFIILVIMIIQRLAPVKGLNLLQPHDLQQQLKQNKNIKLVDVRQPYEFRSERLTEEAINLPLKKIKTEAPNVLQKDAEIILVCLTGVRSKMAARKLRRLGFTNLSHLEGGIVRWNQVIQQK